MADVDACRSCLAAVRVLRVSLVDELEGRVESLLEALVSREAFTRDDRELVLCQPGPRARVRKVLDILECKGEEAARAFFSARSHGGPSARTPTQEYKKLQQKHKDVLRRRSESMLFYNSRHGEKILFSERYVDLVLADGPRGLEVKRHEVLAFGRERLSLQQASAPQRKITPAELFSTAAGKRPIRKVLVTGVAGIGKTVLVQKMLSDFGRGEAFLEFDFVVHMSFRDLNLIDRPTSLRELVLRKNGHLAKELDAVLANDDRLLIVLDGFDEFRRYRSCDVDVFVTEPGDAADVTEILGSLLLGELLPNAAVMLTSRPTAVDHVPVGCIDRSVLVAGFSLAQVHDYFLRYFQDAAVADRTFAAVSANELMLTLCYIPAFCNIVCCILKDGEDLCGESPKTMTDIYVQYLVALLRSHTQARAEVGLRERRPGAGRQLSDMVLKLGRLAFGKLMEHQTLFYASDPDVAALEGCGLVSTFLDRTVAQEPGCTDEVFSFAHLTVQEFFAALYCAVTEQPFPDAAGPEEEAESARAHLDLFSRFLAGVLSDRNSSFLWRQVGLRCRMDKVEAYRRKIATDLKTLCGTGAHVLNCLHCLFEQQDESLASGVRRAALRVNVSDETLSRMDHSAIGYFLRLTKGKLTELDLTGTGVNCESLRGFRPFLPRCERLWLGENSLDMDAVQVVADVLRVSENITHLGLGWSNIGDEELRALCSAVRVNKQLQELWLEGNRVSCRGLFSLSDLTPYPLKTVVAIWNDVYDLESESELGQDSITVSFTDDDMWEAWGDWIFKRCEVSSNEKLVTVLHKVCKISADCLEARWAKTFYRQLSQLVKRRIEGCTEDDTCKKLMKFHGILSS